MAGQTFQLIVVIFIFLDNLKLEKRVKKLEKRSGLHNERKAVGERPDPVQAARPPVAAP